MSRPLKWQPQLAPPLRCPLCLFPSPGINTHPPPTILFFLLCPLSSSVYSSASTSALSQSIFEAPLFLCTLYSLRVYISFTGKPSHFTPRQYLCCGKGCPLFPAFYHLNISPKQLIYFLRLAFFSFFVLLSSFFSLLPWISNTKAEN